MKVSVIIPTYNRSDVILRSLITWTLQSISETEYEVIVVDNNSTDGSPVFIQDFIKPYSNFRYLLETKPGSTHARHAGARIAKSDILIFCDDDGLFNETCVQSVLDVYNQNPNVDAVAGKIEILWDKPPSAWIAPYEFMLGKLDYGSEIIFGRDIYLNGGIFSIKKTVFHELGGFNPDLMGDYLVGDGDTGLVIKLHNEKRLIGWTPFAQMQHMQFVDKQGTAKDMGRRFFNTGISNTYGFYRKQHFCITFETILYALNSLLFYMKKGIEYSIRRNNKSYFSWMQKKGELTFWLNLRYKTIRDEVKKMDSYSI